MRKVFVVAMREFLAAVRTKMFIFTIFAMPVFMGGSIAVQGFLHDKVDTTDKRMIVVDGTGRLGAALIEDAKRRNENEIYRVTGETRRKVLPGYQLESAPAPESQAPEAYDALAITLSEQVQKGDVFAFLLIRPEVLSPPAEPGERPLVAYHSNNPTYDDLLHWLRPLLMQHIQQARLSDAKIDAQTVMSLLKPVDMPSLGLVLRDAGGQVIPAKRTNEVAAIMVPLGLMMLMYVVTMISAQPLLQSVLEEKMQRIAEVLVACASPFQIMMGKLLGSLAVSLTIVVIYLAGAMYALYRTGYGSYFPVHLLGWFIVFQVLGVIMFGSMFLAVGAAVNDLKEAQSLVMPMMLVVVIPFFVWINVAKEPLAWFSVATSLFPPATPMLMMVRLSVPPGIPLWQPVLGVVLVLATTIVAVFAAGRVFRIGLLSQGKAPKFSELMIWVIRG